MYCTQCGAEIEEGTRFCTKCGAEVQTTSAGNAGGNVETNPFAIGSQTDGNTNLYYGDAAPDVPGFWGAVKTCFRKATTFKGRASRSEYWYWALFVILTVNLPQYVLKALPASGVTQTIYTITNLLMFVYFFPGLSVAIRRLHDVGMSGWNMLWKYIPGTMLTVWLLSIVFRNGLFALEDMDLSGKTLATIIALAVLCFLGATYLLILDCLPSQRKPNKYGLPPQKRGR